MHGNPACFRRSGLACVRIAPMTAFSHADPDGRPRGYGECMITGDKSLHLQLLDRNSPGFIHAGFVTYALPSQATAAAEELNNTPFNVSEHFFAQLPARGCRIQTPLCLQGRMIIVQYAHRGRMSTCWLSLSVDAMTCRCQI